MGVEYSGRKNIFLHPAYRFDSSIGLAAKKKINLIVSNPHFDSHRKIRILEDQKNKWLKTARQAAYFLL
jgi:hypothetical protein